MYVLYAQGPAVHTVLISDVILRMWDTYVVP